MITAPVCQCKHFEKWEAGLNKWTIGMRVRTPDGDGQVIDKVASTWMGW